MNNPEKRTLLRGRIPRHMIEAIDNWVDFGVPPSGLLRRIIKDELFGTMEMVLPRPELLGILPDLVVYFANHTPDEAWGGQKALDSWKGLRNRPQ